MAQEYKVIYSWDNEYLVVRTKNEEQMYRSFSKGEAIARCCEFNGWPVTQNEQEYVEMVRENASS